MGRIVIGRRVPFGAWVVVVAAVSWLAAAHASQWLRSGDARDAFRSALEPGVVEALHDAIPGVVSGRPEEPLGTFWVHPECVACFHYLGSMLDEATELEADGARVVVVVLGSSEAAEVLTRLIPYPILHDANGRLFEEAGITVTPQFLLVAADGSVVRHGRGPTAWGTREPEGSDPAITWTEHDTSAGGQQP